MSEDNGGSELHALDAPLKSASYDSSDGPRETEAGEQKEQSSPLAADGAAKVPTGEAPSPSSVVTQSNDASPPVQAPEHAPVAVASASPQPESVATALAADDLEDADDEPATTKAEAKNPFLVPLQPSKEGGPP